MLAAGQPARKAAAKTAIPAAAVKGDDGGYHYTDAKGKKWIFRKTPFGVAKIEDKPAPAPAISDEMRYANVKATEDGGVIRFERPGPFGTYKWERKKAELNEMEQAAWNREKARASTQD